MACPTNLFGCMIMHFTLRMISRQEGGRTATSHDHEYADWDSRTSAENFKSEIEQGK